MTMLRNVALLLPVRVRLGVKLFRLTDRESRNGLAAPSLCRDSCKCTEHWCRAQRQRLRSPFSITHFSSRLGYERRHVGESVAETAAYTFSTLGEGRYVTSYFAATVCNRDRRGGYPGQRHRA